MVKARDVKIDNLKAFIMRLNSSSEPEVRRTEQRNFKLPDTLLMGSACSGIETTTMACEEMKDRKFRLKFWVEKDKLCQAFLRRNFVADVEYDDVFDDAFLQGAPYTHGFTAGFPCQPYSSIGLHLAGKDPRSQVITALIHHIEARAPRFFILENVLGLAVNHSATLESIVLALRNVSTSDGDSYKVQVAVLNSRDFQVPQRRTRIYIMGVLKMGRTTLKIEWPLPTGRVGIQSVLDNEEKLASYSSYPLPRATNAKRNILRAIDKAKKLAELKPPMSAESIPMIVDLACGASFNWGLDETPTLTRARGSGMAFFSLQHGRKLNIRELMKVQGVNPRRVELAGVSVNQFGGMLGNAFTVPIIKALIETAINAAEQK